MTLLQSDTQNLNALVTGFANLVQQRSQNPQTLLNINELEFLTRQLQKMFESIFSDLMHELLKRIDEKELIRIAKKEYAEQGILLKNHRKASKTILTLNGSLTFSRSILIPADEVSRERLWALSGVRSVVPLDEKLGIARLPFKMSVALMEKVASVGQKAPSYEEAAKILHAELGFRISKETVRNVTSHIGKTAP